MASRIVTILLSVAFTFGLAACKEDPKKAAAERLAAERAKKKELAIKQYQTLIEKYPNSPQAEKAKERLRALGPAATPKKK
jgi:TolA-binding protein